MQSLKHARSFLLDLERGDLAVLLEGSSYQIAEEDILFGLQQKLIKLISPPTCADALTSLSNSDKKRLLESIIANDINLQNSWLDHNSLSFEKNPQLKIDAKTDLLANVVAQRGLMVQVATGGPRINDVNDYYRARRKKIQRVLEVFQLEDPNPYESLWDWYKKWKEDFPTYSDRRIYIYSLYKPLVTTLMDRPPTPSPAREPTGWQRLDRALSKARNAMDWAQTEEDFQTVGLLCREVLISLGQAVYKPTKHNSPDGIEPSNTDAKRMLEAFIAATLGGKSNENVRRHTKASLSLALDLQHRRTATYRIAVLCLEATSSTVNVIAILAGRRDRSGNDK